MFGCWLDPESGAPMNRTSDLTKDSLGSSLNPSIIWGHSKKMGPGFPDSTVVKEVTLQCRGCEFDPWIGKIRWSRTWQPHAVLLPGRFHRLWSLVGYSPWGRNELVTTEHAHTWIRKWTLTRHWFCTHLDLRLCHLPKLRERTIFLKIVYPPSLWYFCYSIPNETKTDAVPFPTVLFRSG